MMRIVVARPPNYAAIVAVFPAAANPGVIFTYGDTIFNPTNAHISHELRAHEGIHGTRQTAARARIEDWWQHYLEDPAFRLGEELPAHQAESGSTAAASAIATRGPATSSTSPSASPRLSMAR